MDAAFRIAAVTRPPEFHVLGLPLKPLTLGHLFVLHDVQSSFVTGSRSTAEDLVIAAFICSQPQETARNIIHTWRAKLFLRLWGLVSRKMDWLQELRNFLEYFAFHLERPAIIHMQFGGSMRELKSPDHWRLLVMLMIDFHMTESQALDTTLLKAHCLWSTEGDRRGTLDLAWGGRLHQFWERCHQLDLEKFGGQN